ncbi:type IV toxin-antitoxin system AbiEi family antitoxin domain-containing protein [Arthrobacter sp. ok362]|uniref:type IV toxin-antitoxin system AbiEi family antitoxin domain-containing protein n=1 Tax=Arthrobacter sp. ok362 TaxID=1761745 RepID=UPI000884D9D4|nr:type IV toxin-antitoxin system AbiEi family antitoxin domain-containing protein [Arthrobacter sp. ok362]SDK67005.1 Transcriptional regulator, AbiEi antitoxin, Type IV TA system [Arthrobacter sp. ok362]
MMDLPRLVLAKDLALLGASSRPLSAAAKSGRLLRLRHGVYVERDLWTNLNFWQQYRLQVEAAAESLQSPTIFSHHSGASVWGIPTILKDQPVHALTTFRGGGRSRAGVRRHLVEPAMAEAQEIEGLLVTSRMATVLDLAAFVPFAEAVVPLDHVLKPDAVRGLAAFAKAELLDALPGRYPLAVERRVRAVVAFADSASGSPGESYSRGVIHVSGFAPPELQYEVRNSTGRVAYSDFYWEGSRTVGEFDGVAKYQRDEFLRGGTPGQVVVDEKIREDRIRATGRNVVRWTWAVLWKPRALEELLSQAGVPRRRRPASGQ